MANTKRNIIILISTIVGLFVIICLFRIISNRRYRKEQEKIDKQNINSEIYIREKFELIDEKLMENYDSNIFSNFMEINRREKDKEVYIKYDLKSNIEINDELEFNLIESISFFLDDKKHIIRSYKITKDNKFVGYKFYMEVERK